MSPHPSPPISGTATDLDPTTLLTRLSQKPGVQSTLILDRNTGAIVRSSGLLSSSSSSSSVNSNTSPLLPASDAAMIIGNDTPGAAARTAKVTTAEEYAGMVWRFVQVAGGLIKGLDGEDDVKLLRLRTKKNELVIVPDSRFLLVVVHDTPPA